MMNNVKINNKVSDFLEIIKKNKQDNVLFYNEESYPVKYRVSDVPLEFLNLEVNDLASSTTGEIALNINFNN